LKEEKVLYLLGEKKKTICLWEEDRGKEEKLYAIFVSSSKKNTLRTPEKKKGQRKEKERNVARKLCAYTEKKRKDAPLVGLGCVKKEEEGGKKK